jgi:hypothetical protein
MGDSVNLHDQTLKTLVEAPEILVCPGVYDGYSARLVEKMASKRPAFPERAYRKAGLAIRIEALWDMAITSMRVGISPVAQTYYYKEMLIPATATR